ncbi:MAG TPA: rod shape-determining protein MreD, partial [Candidatus Eisenbacteria bacterium]|nr:rod shape-determining protein MreD [Candidatus Eisenbacteria bacterium]
AAAPGARRHRGDAAVRAIGALFATAALALLLRSTALSSLAAHGVVVDVLAFATVVWALRHGEAWGSTFGFVIGLLADLDAAHWLGRHALALALLGYGTGRLSTTLVRESPFTQLLLLAVVTAIHQAWAAAFELSGGGSGVPFLLGRVLLATLVTAPLGTLLLIGARRLTGRPLFGYASRPSTTG